MPHTGAPLLQVRALAAITTDAGLTEYLREALPCACLHPDNLEGSTGACATCQVWRADLSQSSDGVQDGV